MKIRNGFVSNSSSSSFLVKIKSDEMEKIFLESNKTFLSKENMKLLKQYHFQETNCNDAFLLENVDSFDSKKDLQSEKSYLYYNIVCNQDYVMSLLVKNNIPFTAAIHYGHELAVFEKDSEMVYFFKNFGRIFHSYDSIKENIEEIKMYGNKPYTTVPIKNYQYEDKEIKQIMRYTE
jgi:hypothetical protein